MIELEKDHFMDMLTLKKDEFIQNTWKLSSWTNPQYNRLATPIRNFIYNTCLSCPHGRIPHKVYFHHTKTERFQPYKFSMQGLILDSYFE